MEGREGKKTGWREERSIGGIMRDRRCQRAQRRERKMEGEGRVVLLEVTLSELVSTPSFIQISFT